MTKDEALRLALEALEDACGNRCNAEYNPCFQRETITAIKQALEQPEPEPVAWMIWLEGNAGMYPIKREAQIEFARRNKEYPDDGRKLIPLYTTPPKREPLTDEQIDAIQMPRDPDYDDKLRFARAIEAAHGIKGDA